MGGSGYGVGGGRIRAGQKVGAEGYTGAMAESRTEREREFYAKCTRGDGRWQGVLRWQGFWDRYGIGHGLATDEGGM